VADLPVTLDITRTVTFGVDEMEGGSSGPPPVPPTTNNIKWLTDTLVWGAGNKLTWG